MSTESSDLERELRAIEAERLRALVARDMAVAERLHADEYELITPRGATYTKQAYLDEIRTGALAYAAFEPESAERIAVRVTGEAAILRYVALIRVAQDSAATLAIRVWHTDYYEKRGREWRAVWSQATRIVE